MRNESVEDFVIHLKQTGKSCEFGDDISNQIRDQVLYEWTEIEMKRKWYSWEKIVSWQTFGNSQIILVQGEYTGNRKDQQGREFELSCEIQCQSCQR